MSDIVRPLLKRREIVGVLEDQEFAKLTLKVGLRVHGCEIVRWHTVILDSLKKMRADALRVTVGVLKGEVIQRYFSGSSYLLVTAGQRS